MNITELIVEFVQQGNVVEFPGMGTLTGSNVSAHHDAATGTYYPARRTVALTATMSGTKAIVRHIADKECVTIDIAEQMWGNFVAALDEKLKKDTAGHEFPGLGTLRQQGGKVVFEAIEGLDLDAGKKHEQPLEHVATYTPKEAPDPFAAFDAPQPAAPAEAPVETAPEPTAAAEPEPEVETAAAVAATAAAATASAADLSEIKKQLENMPSSADKGKSSRQAAKEAAKAEKEAAKALAEAEKAAAKEAKELEKRQRNAEKQAAKEAAKAEKERIAAAKSVEKTSQQAKRESAKAVRAAEKAAAKEAREALKAAKKAEKAARKEAKPADPDRHKGRAIVWVAIIALVLFGAGVAGYRFYRGYVPETKGTNNAQHIELPPYSRFSRDLGTVAYDEALIDDSRMKVGAFMDEYIRAYLSDRHYLNARAVVMDRIDEYANQRLHELMTDDRFAVQRLFPFNDYYFNFCYGELQQAGAYRARCRVQGELMDAERLDQFLDALISEMGLHPDGTRAGAAAANGAAANNAAKNAEYVENVPPAPTFKASKQGFDIIAGFCTQKSHADKMTNQLKSLGCDAYIINRSGLYYVSMGSASSQTAAEALYSHIKSWYKGDISIKNWNE